MKILLSLVGGAVGGACLWLGFPGHTGGIVTLVGVGLVALFGLTRGRGAGHAALVGAAWGSAFFIPHTSWAREAVGTAGPWLALAGVQILFVTAWAWGIGFCSTRRWVREHPWGWWVLVTVTYPGLEQVRARFPYDGFGWGMIAYPQVDSPLVALAPWVGEVGVSLVVSGLAAAIVLLVFPFTRWRTRAASLIVGVVVAFAVVALPPPFDTPTTYLRVGAVQGNVAEPVKEHYGSGEVLANHVRQTAESLREEDVDLIVWGEHAADRDPLADPDAGEELARLARSLRAPLLYGTVRAEGNQRWGEYRWYGNPEATYAKRHPVPFGEYIPHRDFYATLTPEVRQIPHDMVAGQTGGVLAVDTPAGVIHPGIALCFEVAFDRHVRDDVRAGADLILVPTNNALFGRTGESVQQLQMTRFRAAEYGRAALQVSTQGVSGIVSPEGSLVARTNLFTARTLLARVPLTTDLTPAARIGGSLEVGVLAFTLAWFALTLAASPVVARRRRSVTLLTRTRKGA